MTNQELYLARLQRVEDAVAMKKPDRIPVMPFARQYPYVRQGHTMAEAMNDTALAAEDMKRFVTDFEPDLVIPAAASLAGAGKAMEELGLRFIEWPGRTGGPLSGNGITQLIEAPTLDEDGYEDFIAAPASFLPKVTGEGEAVRAYAEAAGSLSAELEELGFPTAFCAAAAPAYDVLSLCRGTLDLMMDLFAQEEEVQEALEVLCPLTVRFAAEQAKKSRGRFVYVPMLNGMEEYMSADTFEEFYFPTLKKLTEGLLHEGLTPILYAEGGYNSRLELLSTLPKGIVFHLDSVNMAAARNTVGKEHCISGGFYAYDLVHSNPADIDRYLKSLLDTVAADGGYIFDFGDKLDDALPENIETVFRILRDY